MLNNILQNKKSPDVSTVGFYIIIESKSLFLKKDIFLLTFVGIRAIPLFECKMADMVEVKALKGFEEVCVLKETICWFLHFVNSANETFFLTWKDPKTLFTAHCNVSPKLLTLIIMF